MEKTPIEDDEILFRRVPNTPDYIVRRDGKIRISSQAFAERHYRPSVDRAKFREHNPRLCQQKTTDAVVSVIAGNVRAILSVVKNDGNGHLVQQYYVDVEHVPIENDPIEQDNLAHAEIFTKPPSDKSVFRKLKESLALLANLRLWDVEPPPSF